MILASAWQPAIACQCTLGQSAEDHLSSVGIIANALIVEARLLDERERQDLGYMEDYTFAANSVAVARLAVSNYIKGETEDLQLEAYFDTSDYQCNRFLPEVGREAILFIQKIENRLWVLACDQTPYARFQHLDRSQIELDDLMKTPWSSLYVSQEHADKERREFIRRATEQMQAGDEGANWP